MAGCGFILKYIVVYNIVMAWVLEWQCIVVPNPTDINPFHGLGSSELKRVSSNLNMVTSLKLN